MGVADNVMRSFVAMDALPAPLAEGPYGQVMDMDGFLHWLAGSPEAGA